MGSLDTPPPLDSLEPLAFGLLPLFYLDPKFFRCILKDIVVRLPALVLWGLIEAAGWA
jgi:hypothetical protein